MGKQHNEKRQNYKFDEVGLVIIIILIAVIIAFYEKSLNPAEVNVEKITTMIFDHEPASFAKDGVIEQNKLQEIQKMDYVELKNSLGIKKDFCIYVEDENGNIILEKGDEKLSQDGVYCGS